MKMVHGFRTILCYLLGTLLFFVFSAGQLSATLIDMRDVLHDRYKENEEKGDLKEFPKSMLNGDLYEKAHAMAELQLAHPALQALDLTYQVISDRCNGENILARDVTTLFAQSSVGEHFRMLLDARESLSAVQDQGFAKSCLAVYACYNKEALVARGVQLETLKYSDTTFQSCTSTVNEIFMIMYERASSLGSMKNLNYGDEFLVNGNADDGPYDLLLDIQAIGDILFTHNDGPSEIHFYDMQQLGSYVTNDPDKLTPFETNNPAQKDRIDRLPVTNGLTPSVPTESTPLFPPNQQGAGTAPPAGLSAVMPGTSTFSTNLASPSVYMKKDTSRGILPQQIGEQGGTTIANILCEEPIAYGVPQQDILGLAQQENEQTETYNTKLDLDTQVALLLVSKISPELEEQIGIIPRGGISDYEEVGTMSEEAQEAAKQIFAELIDIGGEKLEDTKNHIQGCVEQFTDGDKDAWLKILFKSITQPAEFTKCVFGHMCKEIGDPTGRGMFRIKVCRELDKGSGLVSNQTIKSSEEVIDEMLNVCTTLKESGALLEHNKTKDHIEDKMMRIKFADKFAFGVSVIFKGPRDAIDPAIAKQKARQDRAYLETVQLRISDDLSFVEERNKYLILQSAGAEGGFDADLNMAKRNQEQIEKNALLADKMYNEGVAANKNEVATQFQLDTTAGVVEQIQSFLMQNIEMWKTANQYTDAINKRWATTLQLYQASPN